MIHLTKSFGRFLREELAKQKNVPSGLTLIDEACLLSGAVLIRGESGCGSTALALALADSFSKNNRPVLYINPVPEPRATGNYIRVCPWNFPPGELLDFIHECSLKNGVIILDHSFLMRKLWDWPFEEFIRRLKIVSKGLIIVTQRSKTYADIWDEVVTIRHLRNLYDEILGVSTYSGQLISIEGSQGKVKAFIDKKGNYSKAYQYVVEKRREGYNGNTYEYGNYKVIGPWKFIFGVTNNGINID